MFAELLSVIGGDHHQEIPRWAALLQCRQQRSNLVVDVSNRPVICLDLTMDLFGSEYALPVDLFVDETAGVRLLRESASVRLWRQV